MSRLSRGFSLIEMAIVLMLMGLMLGGMVMPLAQSVEQQRRSAAQHQLAEIREALLGFAAAHGRLPCPADRSTKGRERAECASPPNNHGHLPAGDLGIAGPYDVDGLLLDPWGHPFRYSVATSNTGAFTATAPEKQMRAIGIGNLRPRLHLCNHALGCDFDHSTVRSLPAIFFSGGKRGANSAESASPDELENSDGDDSFVDRAPSEIPGAEYSALMGWISPNLLYARMIQAGQLP